MSFTSTFIGVKLFIKYLSIVLVLTYLSSCKSKKAVTTTTKHADKPKETVKKPSSLKEKYAAKLGVSESNIKNEKLYQFINEWYGVPYKYAGNDKRGIDCSGLTSTLYSVVYQKKISHSTKALVDEVKRIKQSELREGDLVFFNTSGKGVSHVGVYLQNNKFVHASTKKGVMISDMNEPYFKSTYMSAGRVK
jgi:lipoprotein Spr